MASTMIYNHKTHRQTSRSFLVLFYYSILAFYYSILDFYNSTHDFYHSILDFNHWILDFYYSILYFYNSILDLYYSKLAFCNSILDTVRKEILQWFRLRTDSGIVPRRVRIPSVGILTLRRAILELSRFSLCAEHIQGGESIQSSTTPDPKQNRLGK